MKGFKKSLVYILIVLFALIAIVLGTFAFMYFSPGTALLGYEYVLCKNSATETYNLTTDPSVENIKGLEIQTNICDVYIYPNGESDEIKVVESLKFSGFVKQINSNCKVDVSVYDKIFSQSSAQVKTLKINVTEPTGWVSKNGSFVKVYIPENLEIKNLLVNSKEGDIKYSSDVGENKIAFDDVYLQTSNYGKIFINNKQTINNYYLATGYSTLSFEDTNSISANKITFQTESGNFVFSNNASTATLNLTNGLVVSSTNNTSGPHIKIDVLNSDLKADCKNGTFNIGQIGQEDSPKQVAFSTNKATIKFKKVYGNISVLSGEGDTQNNVSITNFKSTGLSNIIESGAGNVLVEKLDGTLAVETSSGNINLKNVSYDKTIALSTRSGDINIDYNFHAGNVLDASLKIVTATGNIKVNNLSCKFDIKVLNSSSNKKLDINFSAIAENDNKIEAKDRNVNLVIVGTGGGTYKFRVLTTKIAEIVDSTVASQISSTAPQDRDNLVTTDEEDTYYGYNYNYRVGYIKSDIDDVYTLNEYQAGGKILIKTNGLTTISSKSV